MTEPTVLLKAICGCGKLEAVATTPGGVERVVSEAMKHATTLGHTLEFQGEIRVQRSSVQVVG